MPVSNIQKDNEKPFTYGNNLLVDIKSSEYQFQDNSNIEIPKKLYTIYEEYTNHGIINISSDISVLLTDLIGYGDSSQLWSLWSRKVNDWYFRILDDELLGLGQYETLSKVVDKCKWIELNEIERVVEEIVNNTPVIDLHTHLFAASHGELNLFGIDELLTYHYLVAEFFMVADMDMTTESKLN